MRTITYSGGQQYISYRGILPREDTEQTVLLIPGNCVAVTNECNDLEVTCWREHIIDGKCFKISAIFGNESTSIKLRDTRFPLSYVMNPVQSNIDGVVFVMENLRICQGYKITNAETSDGLTEKWTHIMNENQVEMRVRSKACKNILSFYSKVDHCQVCIEKYKRAKKRESSNQDKDTPEPKIAKVENTTVRTPLKEISIDPNPVTNNNQQQTSIDENETKETPTKVSTAIDELLAAGSPEKFKLFLEMQLQNSQPDIDKRQRKWDPEFISFCLGIYVRSPRIYRDLRESPMLVLPSESLLKMYKNCIKQKPGINQDNLTWMAKEAERQKVRNFGRRGGLIVDEMSIQDELQIVRKGDAWTIVGGVDMGETNNTISVITNNTKKTELATHSLQYIFHGFTGFRWPVAYYGSNPASTHQLYNTFWDCVDALDELGFRVDYLMFDGASTNRSLMNMLLNKTPRANKFTAKNIFCNDQKLYVIQDVKHVLKKIRNNFEASKLNNRSAAGRFLVLDGKAIVWDHIESAYQFNNQSGLRIHRHLTKEHIELTSSSKMRNRLAEQVLDKDMLFLVKSYQATLDQPEVLASTVQFLENTSVLVDIFTDRRPICETTDRRLQQLGNVLNFFNTWESDVTKSVLYTPAKHLLPQETRDDLNSSIVGFTMMCSDLLGKGDSITPAFMNSDVVENHFCQQRGTCNGMNTNPTLAQYGPSNTSICLSQSSISSKNNSGIKAENFKATTPCALNKRSKIITPRL